MDMDRMFHQMKSVEARLEWDSNISRAKVLGEFPGMGGDVYVTEVY